MVHTWLGIIFSMVLGADLLRVDPQDIAGLLLSGVGILSAAVAAMFFIFKKQNASHAVTVKNLYESFTKQTAEANAKFMETQVAQTNKLSEVVQDNTIAMTGFKSSMDNLNLTMNRLIDKR